MTRSLNLSAFLLLVVVASPAETAQPSSMPVSQLPAVSAPPPPQPATTPRQPVAANISRLAVPAASGAVVAPTPTVSVGIPAPALEGAPSGSWTGEARWCAPTPDKCQDWGDGAMVGAVNSFTFGDEPYWVRVEYAGKATEVLIVSHCACANRHDRIDLSTAAFDDLAPLSRGVIPVTVTDARFADRPLPRTDTPDQHPQDRPEHPDDERMRREVRDDTLYGGPE